MAHVGGSLAVIRAHRLELSKAFANSGQCLLQENSTRILQDYLDYLEQAFSAENCLVDIGEIQEMLLEFSCIVRSSGSEIGADEYSGLLKRLIAIYSRGYTLDEEDRLSTTAPDYADIIEAIAGNHPDYDYSEAVGQLIYYLNHLYQHRKGSWKTVYDHILAMPDSIVPIRALKEAYFHGVHQWVEEGVQHLFDIRRDVAQSISELKISCSDLTSEIERQEARLEAHTHIRDLRCHHNLVDLDLERGKRALKKLSAQRQRILIKQRDKEQVAQLIESNIREFETSLKEARRAYFVRQIRSGYFPTSRAIKESSVG